MDHRDFQVIPVENSHSLGHWTSSSLFSVVPPYVYHSAGALGMHVRELNRVFGHTFC
jgi:hypothetical protein